MKRIDELGIGPMPWAVEDKGVFVIDSVNDANGDVITGVIDTPNARLIAAAPELYEALRDAVSDRCRTCPSHRRAVCEKIGMPDCYVNRWKSALTKASGEEAER